MGGLRNYFLSLLVSAVTALLTARRMRIHLPAALATMAAFAAASGDAAADAPKSIDAATPPGVVQAALPWRVGAIPLPLRRDGFGMVMTTPPPLRDRRLPTVDRLPPPTSGRFEFTVRSGEQAIQAGMPAVHPECPVRLDDLAYLTVTFWGFDGRPHTGEIVIHRRVAKDIVGVFARLYDVRFPIEGMRIITAAEIAAPPTGDGNNTAAFTCRVSLGAQKRQKQWSAHAYGLAVDLNPFQNPYWHGSLVLPELAFAYTDRNWVRPGMIRPGDVVTRAFAEIGWTWGGTWQSRLDYMHFSESGK
jgi:hypothetical protein